jgi:two-component system LytT family response regulator
MPECDGFDVLELLGADLPQVLVFVTAYDEYALRAFEAGALDYLLKPFDDARFHRALHRAKDKLAHYAPLHSQPAKAPRRPISGTAAVRECRRHRLDRGRELLRLPARGQQHHVIRRTLSDLEQDLGEKRFVRIHRSIIVNLERIHALELHSSGGYEVVLKSQVWLRLSRRFRKRLQDRMSIRTAGAS